MKRHFVTFLSPGTFVAEDTTKPITSWDVEIASEMANDVSERCGATPFGFYFTTRERKGDELDSKVIKRSGTYFLGGKIETLEEVKARATEDDRILISNMEGNGYKKVITNDNSWRWTQPFEDGDVFLNWKPKEKKHGKPA